jgi:hypothetical protein
MSKVWRYGKALVAGLLTTAACVAAALALAMLAGPEESGFFLTAVGLGVGLPMGGAVAGRLAKPELDSSAPPWLALLALAPGLWLVLFVWASELRRFGPGSEYFQELLLPGLFGILLGIGGAAWGSRTSVAGPHRSRDVS